MELVTLRRAKECQLNMNPEVLAVPHDPEMKNLCNGEMWLAKSPRFVKWIYLEDHRRIRSAVLFAH